MTTVFQEQFIKHFNIFLEQLKVIFSKDDTILILNNIHALSDMDKLQSGEKFNILFTDELFDQFIKNKIKVFSHKDPKTKDISESLFGSNFCLKNLLNNQPENVKAVIWTHLHTIYFMSELQKSSDIINTERISILSKMLHINNPTEQSNEDTSNKPTPKNVSKKLHDILGVDVNKDTTEMIDEIVASFEKIMNKTSKTNPISSIMEISKLISVKYADKINNGEIEIDKLMEAISKKVPGMDKMMDQMMNVMKTEKVKPKEKVVIDENFSTALVEVGKKDDDSGGMKFGSMLKMADQFGVIPGGKKSEGGMANMMSSMMSGMQSNGNNMPDISSMMKSMNNGEMPDVSSMMASMNDGKLPDISEMIKTMMPQGENGPNMEKIVGMMQKMQTSKTPEQAAELKAEMDTFMQSELGVDMTELNQQIDSFTNNLKEADENTQENNKDTQ